jgi:hypothetical protein
MIIGLVHDHYNKILPIAVYLKCQRNETTTPGLYSFILI